MNAMRREHYAERKDIIKAKKRAAYAERKLCEEANDGTIDYNKAVFAGKHDILWHLEKHQAKFKEWTEERYLQRARELLTMPLKSRKLEEITRSDGSISRYCYSTNEFVELTEDGNIGTFFKPK